MNRSIQHVPQSQPCRLEEPHQQEPQQQEPRRSIGSFVDTELVEIDSTAAYAASLGFESMRVKALRSGDQTRARSFAADAAYFRSLVDFIASR